MRQSAATELLRFRPEMAATRGGITSPAQPFSQTQGSMALSCSIGRNRLICIKGSSVWEDIIAKS